MGDVASGSPAWEAGLNPGDVVTFLAFAAKPVAGGANAWMDRLRHPEPGKELFLKVVHPGQREPIDMLTTVRQRPLWKFFATQDNEWVLWRWRDYFYDTSTNGDFYIGWEIIESVRQTPEFHEAERFRRLFHRPDKVVEMLREANFASERVSVPQFLPPKVDISVRPFPAEQKEIEVEIRVSPAPRRSPASQPWWRCGSTMSSRSSPGLRSIRKARKRSRCREIDCGRGRMSSWPRCGMRTACGQIPQGQRFPGRRSPGVRASAACSSAFTTTVALSSPTTAASRSGRECPICCFPSTMPTPYGTSGKGRQKPDSTARSLPRNSSINKFTARRW